MTPVLDISYPIMAPALLPELDAPMNSRVAASLREETQMEQLVYEIIHFTPDYAEMLALDGVSRLSN